MEIKKDGGGFTITLQDIVLRFPTDSHGYMRPEIQISEAGLHDLFAHMVRHLLGNLVMRKECTVGWSAEFEKIIVREMIRLFREIALASTKDESDRKQLAYFLNPAGQRVLSAFLKAIETKDPATPAVAAI